MAIIFRCEKHGDHITSYTLTDKDKNLKIRYCMQCFVENVLDKFCNKVEVIMDREAFLLNKAAHDGLGKAEKQELMNLIAQRQKDQNKDKTANN